MPTEVAWLLRFVRAPTCLPSNYTHAGHTSDVDMVRWHPNCHYIASGSSDRTVRLWDVRTGECARLLVGHKDRVRLAFYSLCLLSWQPAQLAFVAVAAAASSRACCW